MSNPTSDNPVVFAGYAVDAAPESRSHVLRGLPLGTGAIADEFLHAPANSGHYSSTETSYFGFSIPERQLNAEIYLWFHPALRMMSAGVYVWTGLKASSLACEYVNHHHYLPWPENGIADYAIDALGLRIRVIEPLRSIQLDLDDRDRGLAFSCRQDAIMPPGVRPGGFHFTQAMKTSGWVELHGERLLIDGYFSRDRSWGQERREDPMPLPPLSWMVGVFGDDLAFHALAHDDPSANPEWATAFPNVRPKENMFWGYVWRDGRLVPLLGATRKRTLREADGLAPTRVDMELEDIEGYRLALLGHVQARVPWQTWQNMNTYFCQVRWEAGERLGYGDVQDVQFHSFTRQFTR